MPRTSMVELVRFNVAWLRPPPPLAMVRLLKVRIVEIRYVQRAVGIVTRGDDDAVSDVHVDRVDIERTLVWCRWWRCTGRLAA